MWRTWTLADESEIVRMSLALYAEDPAAEPVPEEHTWQTLATLRAQPLRGRAVVLEVGNVIAGYAFLISFWSNELGGEVLVIDELYVRHLYRNQGHARSLLRALGREGMLWPDTLVALELEVTPQNARAAALYGGLGFRQIKNSRLRLPLR